MNELVKNELLGVGVTNATHNEILEYIYEKIEKTRDNLYIVTPNPEIIVYANSHPTFKNILNRAQIALCDGVGIVWAGKILGKPFKERITGVDLVELVCKSSAKKPITVGFLGGKEGIAEKVSECLKEKYQGLKVGFVGTEWPGQGIGYRVQGTGDKNGKSSLNLDRHDDRLNPKLDILFVALGFPKQEEFMSSHLNEVPVRVMVGVGGAFDYISGNVARAPKPLRNLGLEWLFRLILQPWRFKRQVALATFTGMVIRERMAMQNSSHKLGK